VGTVENDNRAGLRSVVLGHDLGNEVEVVSGISAGDSVIVDPPDSLISGESVRIGTADGSGNGPAGNSP
jgi:hypothetical protein